jgi:hypothetical protein
LLEELDRVAGRVHYLAHREAEPVDIEARAASTSSTTR